MGGGGGRSYDTSDVNRLAREASREADQAAYDAAVNEALKDALSNFNARDAEAIRSHLDEIVEAVGEGVDGSLDMVFGGSVGKNTYIEGLSDVDVLLRLTNSELQGMSPRQVLEYMRGKLAGKFGADNVKVGDLAVTVRCSDGTEIQVLPAVSSGAGVKIPVPGSSEWSKTVRPDRFAAKLTEVNKANSGHVVPTVKLFKAMLEKALPPGAKVSGYHAESLAIEAFKNYSGRQTRKDMLAHLCSSASEKVMSPIKDSSGQSVHVDDYLGSAGSSDRQRVSGALKRLATKLTTADSQHSTQAWKDLLGD